jgi:hypothetical protein
LTFTRLMYHSRMLNKTDTHPIENELRKEAIARRISCKASSWLVNLDGKELGIVEDLHRFIESKLNVPDHQLNPTGIFRMIGEQHTFEGLAKDFKQLVEKKEAKQ